MDFNQILNQVVNIAKNSASNLQTGNPTLDNITKVGGGAAITGILSMILGRSGGASLAKLGSLAVLGNLAYQAYQNYQKNQQAQPVMSANEFDVLNSASQQDASALILRTMIAAAAADGEITEEEKQTIANEIGDNAELAQWIEQEMANPISVSDIARQVGNDTALATNVYLATRLVSKDLSRKEIIFLANLAEALGLDDALVEQLEKQAGF
ncbi:3-hydroxyisobutyrate dehydrogenase [Rodentibacter pneumotropicus]|uniref:Tellurite resistance TerB family protein n=1 Tax=Rodentibacter pneumotropicus TaxID=758 RepID=A0AAW5LD65_9PAST|nr:tellurite resistance TerB family protein [Rodentibacter pneumotropicus]MCQ9121400.1 tellurite resistance TerB family protein [Rodentibacter pneumotropicus]OOF66307.1 3-hydroxyisobutyrate dehydrogenase [Rodentibacter pneumotropicus]